MHIINGIKDFIKNKPVLFTTPGHNLGKGILPEIKELIGDKVFSSDLSELVGLDNLQNPSGIILKSQIRSSEIYGSKNTFYLVNGSTSGIIAIMLSSINPGEKILIARNAHKSVINSLVMSGAVPVWMNTEWLDDWNIPGPVNLIKLKKKLNKNTDIKAVFITSPTYEGVISDIRRISEVCKKREILLFVDEAHGALWNFSDYLPTPAIHLGADASVQSLHKTATSLTPGALLHISLKSTLSSNKIQKALNLINTTSPSYVVMASIEGSVEYLVSEKGKRKLAKYLKNNDEFREILSQNSIIKFLKDTDFYKVDKTRHLFRVGNLSGSKLAEFIQEKYNIEVELDNDLSILAYTGIGTQKKNLKKLAQAVTEGIKSLTDDSNINPVTPLIEPKVAFSPREAFYKNSRKIELKKSLGLISKETIVPYPPGIPLLISGELIQEAHIKLLKDRNAIEIIMD